jgi:hypothetical protein
MKKIRIDGLGSVTEGFFDDPITKYVLMTTLVISILFVTEAFLDGNQKNGIFLSLADRQFINNFVEWFGVIYGFVWSTIVVKVWEQFEKTCNTFDREADAIQLLAEDLRLLGHKEFGTKVLSSLQEYTQNVLLLMNRKKTYKEEEKDGNDILSRIRGYYFEVFQQKSGNNYESDVLLDEILTQLNTIVDNRGDRITFVSQKTFDSLKLISMITSIVWLAPFYFLYYEDKAGNQLQLGIFGWLLIIAVTFLVIVIMSIMDDLDGPFDGIWQVDIESWANIEKLLGIEIRSLQEEKRPPEIQFKSERVTRGLFSTIITIMSYLFALSNRYLFSSSSRKKSKS